MSWLSNPLITWRRTSQYFKHSRESAPTPFLCMKVFKDKSEQDLYLLTSRKAPVINPAVSNTVIFKGLKRL